MIVFMTVFIQSAYRVIEMVYDCFCIYGRKCFVWCVYFGCELEMGCLVCVDGGACLCR